jgi:hypothetical protein
MASKRVLEVLDRAASLADSAVVGFMATTADEIPEKLAPETHAAAEQLEARARMLRQRLAGRIEACSGAAHVVGTAKWLGSAPALKASCGRLQGWSLVTTGPAAYDRAVFLRETDSSGGEDSEGESGTPEDRRLVLMTFVKDKNRRLRFVLEDYNNMETFVLCASSETHTDSSDHEFCKNKLTMDYVWPLKDVAPNPHESEKRFGWEIFGRATDRSELTEFYAFAWFLCLLSIDGLLSDDVPDVVIQHLFLSAAQLATTFSSHPSFNDTDWFCHDQVATLVRRGVIILRALADEDRAAAPPSAAGPAKCARIE